MNIDKKNGYTFITPNEETIQLFYESFIKKIDYTEGEHIIIDFSEKINTSLQEILLFLNVANEFREQNTSFIIVANGMNIDEIPDEISIVPTLTEALDTLEMDDIERDLMNF